MALHLPIGFLWVPVWLDKGIIRIVIIRMYKDVCWLNRIQDAAKAVHHEQSRIKIHFLSTKIPFSFCQEHKCAAGTCFVKNITSIYINII